MKDNTAASWRPWDEVEVTMQREIQATADALMELAARKLSAAEVATLDWIIAEIDEAREANKEET